MEKLDLIEKAADVETRDERVLEIQKFQIQADEMYQCQRCSQFVDVSE